MIEKSKKLLEHMLKIIEQAEEKSISSLPKELSEFKKTVEKSLNSGYMDIMKLVSSYINLFVY